MFAEITFTIVDSLCCEVKRGRWHSNDSNDDGDDNDVAGDDGASAVSAA